MVEVPKRGGTSPTAKQLKASGNPMVNKKLGMGGEIQVYANGYAVYQIGGRSTVFSVCLCRDYFYLSDGRLIHVPEKFFEGEKWYLRLVLEGEDRLNHNQEERERKFSYSSASEEWAALEDQAESVLEHLVKQETVEEMLQLLTDRQRTVIQKYYMQEKTQMQISKELGISRLAVRDSLFHAVSKIRKKYALQSCPPGCKAGYMEGK